MAVASFGGPLALAALAVPGVVGDAADSAGLAMLAAVLVFTAPLAVWLRYSRQVSGPGGLYGFVEAAAGRPVALAQAGIWIFSYLLYVATRRCRSSMTCSPRCCPASAPTRRCSRC